MRKIYNEVRSHEGKLTEFAEYLVTKGVFKDTKNGMQSLRLNTRDNPEVIRLYEEWRPGRLKTKDMAKHVDKVAKVFKDIQKRTLKQELLTIVDVMEEALKELT